jgi:hypothetical protein
VHKKLFFIFTVLMLSVGAYAMSILDAGKVCLFSKFSGVVTFEGKPVANARLVRKTSLSKDRVDETITDDNGHFEMPAVFERTITKFLPQEFVAKQTVYVYHNDQEYEIWAGVKRKPEENAESRGADLEVSCELTQEKAFKQVNNNPIISRCTWAAEPDEIDTGF